MRAYFVPAAGYAAATRPTIIFTNGYDGTITDMLFASVLAARARGYHSLLFDGPGQEGCCSSTEFRSGRIGRRS